MSETPNDNTDDRTSWFENPGNVRLIIMALVVVCTGLVLAEFFYTNPHPHFDLEKVFGLHAIVGFVAFITVVFMGKGLRLLIKRREDYYDQ
ncbi:MAG: hypothetical protein ACR2NP_14740 [Pirellulaceae bacterium]